MAQNKFEGLGLLGLVVFYFGSLFSYHLPRVTTFVIGPAILLLAWRLHGAWHGALYPGVGDAPGLFILPLLAWPVLIFIAAVGIASVAAGIQRSKDIAAGKDPEGKAGPPKVLLVFTVVLSATAALVWAGHYFTDRRVESLKQRYGLSTCDDQSDEARRLAAFPPERFAALAGELKNRWEENPEWARSVSLEQLPEFADLGARRGELVRDNRGSAQFDLKYCDYIDPLQLNVRITKGATARVELAWGPRESRKTKLLWHRTPPIPGAERR